MSLFSHVMLAFLQIFISQFLLKLHIFKNTRAFFAICECVYTEHVSTIILEPHFHFCVFLRPILQEAELD